MDFPIKLYNMKAFKNTLKRNGFQNIIVHEIENGYGNGNSFKVVECS